MFVLCVGIFYFIIFCYRFVAYKLYLIVGQRLPQKALRGGKLDLEDTNTLVSMRQMINTSIRFIRFKLVSTNGCIPNNEIVRSPETERS